METALRYAEKDDLSAGFANICYVPVDGTTRRNGSGCLL